MSRALLLAELRTGPKSAAQLRGAFRRAGSLSKTIGGLDSMMKAGEVSFSLDFERKRIYALTPAGAAITEAPRQRVRSMRGKPRTNPREHGRDLGVIYEDISINAAAKACTALADTFGAVLVVLTPDRRCVAYVEPSVGATRAWQQHTEDVLGVWVHSGVPGSARAMKRDIADAIEHVLQTFHAAPAAQPKRTRAPAGATP